MLAKMEKPMTIIKKRITKPVIKVNGQTYYHSDIRVPNKGKRRPFISANGQHMNEIAATDYIGLAVKTLQNRRSRRVLPNFRKSGGSVIYLKSDLDEFLEMN